MHPFAVEVIADAIHEDRLCAASAVHEARAARAAARERRGTEAFAHVLASSTFHTAWLSLPVRFGAERSQLALEPVMLSFERGLGDPADFVRIGASWQDGRRHGTGSVELRAAGPGWIEVVVHVRGSRRLGRERRLDAIAWRLANALRERLEDAALRLDPARSVVPPALLVSAARRDLGEATARRGSAATPATACC